AFGERAVDAILQAVDERAAFTPFVRGHGAERLQKLGNRTLAAEGGDAHRLKRRLVAGGGDRLCDLLLERREALVAHGRQAASAAFAFSTMAANAAGSRMARSERTLRSIVISALLSPSMKRL